MRAQSLFYLVPVFIWCVVNDEKVFTSATNSDPNSNQTIKYFVKPEVIEEFGAIDSDEDHPNEGELVHHWCDLSGVWISDDGSVLLTLGFPGGDISLITGYLSQVSVDMSPGGDHRKNWRRRKRAAARRHHSHHHHRHERRHRRHHPHPHGPGRTVRSGSQRRRVGRSGEGGGAEVVDVRPRPEPHFPPPTAGSSGIPSSLTNKTVLQGSAVSRSGPFAVVTRHGWGAVGTMIGQCQTCGGLDTIVARFYSEVEVFACQAALWNEKSVRLMFRKWGERHRARGSSRPNMVETEVVIKQHDRSDKKIPQIPKRVEKVYVDE